MPIIVNNPNGSDSGSGYVVGIIVAIVLLVLFFIFGLPALRGNMQNTNTPTQTQPRVQQPNNTTNNYNSTTTINLGATTTNDN